MASANVSVSDARVQSLEAYLRQSVAHWLNICSNKEHARMNAIRNEFASRLPKRTRNSSRQNSDSTIHVKSAGLETVSFEFQMKPRWSGLNIRSIDPDSSREVELFGLSEILR
eukprot:329286_1